MNLKTLFGFRIIDFGKKSSCRFCFSGFMALKWANTLKLPTKKVLVLVTRLIVVLIYYITSF